MAPPKVYAANDESHTELVIATEDTVEIPQNDGFQVPKSTQKSKISVFRACRRLYRRLYRLIFKLYNKLPWTTRQTISVTISLYAVLYIFLSVPFRIAFYYNPFEQTEKEKVHRWTEELSIFTTLDIVADVIGVVEFVAFYRVWRDALSQLSASVSFELGKKLTRDANRVKMPPSSSGLRRGKAKWTLASIGPLSSISGGVGGDDKYALVRNVQFALEIIALLPMEALPAAFGSYNALHLARITKLCRTYRLRGCIERITSIYSDRAWVQHLSSTGIDNLAQNIGLCAGLCHYVACGYMLIAHAQCGVSLEACHEDVKSSWAIRDRLMGASVARKYSRTLYWASRTVVLLGYDDVTPVSTAETIYAVAVILLGALFGSSLLATFLFIFRFRNARYAAFATHVDNARVYMRSQNITRAVRRQVIGYFSYAWSTHHGLDSEKALHLMPKHLQSKVVATLKASRVKQVCFLTKESVEFTNLLALALVRRVYSPGDQITEPKFNAQMFFVVRGKVVLSAFNGSNPKECNTGDFFADSCLLYPDKYEEKAVAKTFCELYVLAKAKFDEAVTHLHRGNEPEVRARMTETLEKYSTQLRKTKKLLGLRGGHENGESTHSIIDSGEKRRGVDWRLSGSSFRVHWDAVRLVAIVYVAFEVPFFSVFIAMTVDQNIFVEQPTFGMRYALTLLVEMFFAVDLVLRSRYFAYVDESVMLEVEQPDLIFAAYRSNGFYLDLLAWLPVGVALDSLSINAFRERLSLLRVLRLLRVREIPTLLWATSDYYSVSSKAYLIVSLLLGVTLMLHMVGCVWFEMAWVARSTAYENAPRDVMSALSRGDCLFHATNFQNCSWVKFDCYAHIGEAFPLDDPSSVYKSSFAYLRSVYWAIVTLTAVGYGDIVAFSTAESYFAAFWIFVGGIINFGVVGAMSSTISNVMAPRHHHIEKINTLNSLLDRMDISENLSTEIRRFYHHHFAEHKHAYESELLSHLPDQLCYQISSLLHSDAAKSVSLFDSATIEFLHEITGKFRHRSYQHGEAICLEGDICREFFVFLHGSKVNVFFHIRKVPIRALQEGDCYGVGELLLRKVHTATLLAASLVHASVMTREQFDVIQRKFASDVTDIKEEAQIMWVEQQKSMRRVVLNLEKLKLQQHMMQTPSLFCQNESTVTATNRRGITNGKSAQHNAVVARTTFTSTWNAMITSWNIYNAFFVIFRICFHSHIHFSGGVCTAVWLADLACDFCFAIDIYLRLYYFGCTDVGFDNLLSRQEKDTQYLRSSTFRWDLVASLPLYVPAAGGSVVASLCRLPRLVRCIDLLVYMDDVIVQIQQHFASHNVSAYLSPAKLMVILVLMAHIIGSIFFLISENECKHVERCWIEHDHLIHEYHHSVPILYAKSFYWAITTLLLVGSRESVPRDAPGTLWTSLTCLWCTFIIGHIVGEISEQILELGKEVKQYKSRIASFDSFAKENELPESLRERVDFFFRLQFEHTEGLDLHSTIHDLSANLRLKLMLEIYGHSIALLPIRSFLTPSQINNLALRLHSELYIPGDNVLVEGTFGSRLCILRKGVAAVLWSSSMTSIAVLMEGALFGEIAFFLSSQRRLATVRATTSCEVLYITKHDWQDLWTTDGDLSDIQVQKHALHASLDWVRARLYRYERATLRSANRAKRLLATRHAENILNPSAMTSNTRVLSSSSAMKVLPTGVKPRAPLFSESQLLEKKTMYLLTKTHTLADQFRQALVSCHVRRRASSAVSSRSARPNMARALSRTMLRSKRRDATSELFRSTVGDATAPVSHETHSKADIHMLQFIVDLNPVNKLVRNYLSSENVLRLEAESWARYKILAAIQHTVDKLVKNVIPPETAFRGRHDRPLIKIQVSRGVTRRKSSSSFHHEEPGSGNAAPQTSAAVSSSAASRRKPDSAANKLMMAHTIGLTNPGEQGPVRRRRLSVVATQEGIQQQEPPSEGKSIPQRSTLKRSRSLPLFGDKYFESICEEGNETLKVKATNEQARQGHMDFDVIQRCQRPQYATQVHLYQRYRQWKHASQNPSVTNATILPAQVSGVGAPKRLGDIRIQRPSLRGTMQFISRSRRTSIGRQRLSLLGGKLQFAGDTTETMDKQSRAFISRIKKLGKVWDILMLAVAIYHLGITPFKLCFSTDLTELPAETLRAWSGLEVLMDMLCLLDVGYRIHYASLSVHSMGATLANTNKGSVLRRIFVSNPALRLDIFAMLPLELLLFATDIRIPLAYAPSIEDASWWTSRWILRMNRWLLVRRIEPLSEQVFQCLVYDYKLPIGDASLYFLRGLASYLAMGHILACIWYVTSEHGLHHYGTSWLSTSGMLTFISTGASAVEHAGRMLTESAAAFDLDHIALSRKYLRSLLFSMECISTLFYGDIVSMNPVELVVEIIITFWSIYIYGALVGAQGELLDARARREAAFEQSLGELQRYVVQNEVPKKLKRQIKSYYAWVWRRRKGENEFAAVTKASRVLYEDVVFATLGSFAARVAVFRSLDEHFLRGLLVCLEYVVCSEGEEVTMKGDVDRSMYFIGQGRVLVTLDTGESVRERGEFFGELALLYGISRLETCVALVHTEMYRLDQQPYERLLHDFPHYREQNKRVWTTSSAPAPDRVILEDRLHNFQNGYKRCAASSADFPPIDTSDIVANAERINADIPYSHIYKFIMEVLAQLHHVDPLEARDLVLKSRDGARKQLKALLGLATFRDELLRKEIHDVSPSIPTDFAVVSTFQSRWEEEPSPKLKAILFERSTKAKAKVVANDLLVHSVSYTNLLE